MTVWDQTYTGPTDGVPQEVLQFLTSSVPSKGPILKLAKRAAQELPAGSRLLDVGSGESPYRPIFSSLRYETSDWEHTYHADGRIADHIGPADDLPVGNGEFDGVFCTQVLEHVPDPQAVITEFHRVIRPGGRLYLSLPFVWPLHEMPYDFSRFAPNGLQVMLNTAGFTDCDIRGGNDSLSTLAELLRKTAPTVGRYPDGHNAERDQTIAALNVMADHLDSYARLDSRWMFPLNYTVTATRAGGSAPASWQPLAGEVLQDARHALGFAGARRFVTLCFAEDFLNDPFMMSAYTDRFSGADDATLVIYVPNSDPIEAEVALNAEVNRLGLNGPESPDMIGLPVTERLDEALLARSVDAVLATRPPWGAFTGVPWAYSGTMAEIHARAAAT